MDSDLYDEFGNYIGPDLESDSEEEEFDEPEIDVRMKFYFSRVVFVYKNIFRTMRSKMKLKWKLTKTRHRKRLCCTKTNVIIKQRLKFTARKLRRLFRKKTRK